MRQKPPSNFMGYREPTRAVIKWKGSSIPILLPRSGIGHLYAITDPENKSIQHASSCQTTSFTSSVKICNVPSSVTKTRISDKVSSPKTGRLQAAVNYASCCAISIKTFFSLFTISIVTEISESIDESALNSIFGLRLPR